MISARPPHFARALRETSRDQCAAAAKLSRRPRPSQMPTRLSQGRIQPLRSLTQGDDTQPRTISRAGHERSPGPERAPERTCARARRSLPRFQPLTARSGPARTPRPRSAPAYHVTSAAFGAARGEAARRRPLPPKRPAAAQAADGRPSTRSPSPTPPPPIWPAPRAAWILAPQAAGRAR